MSDYDLKPASRLRRGDIFRPRAEGAVERAIYAFEEFELFDNYPFDPPAKGWTRLTTKDGEEMDLPQHHPCDVYKSNETRLP